MTFWRNIAVFLLSATVLLFAWWPTAVHLFDILWNVDVFAHGLVVPVVSLGLIWSRKEHINAAAPQVSFWGLPLIILAVVFWSAGRLLDAALLSHIGLVTGVQAAVLSAIGLRAFRTILFPMLFLYFTVPFGYDLVVPLQHITANLVIGTLDILGVAFNAEGVLIELPSGYYEIAEACAGVKFFFASSVTGVLLSHLVFEGWRHRLGIIAASMLLPIAANALRVLAILAIAEATDQSFAKGVDHIIYGWVFLSIVLFLLISLAYRFSNKSLASASPVQFEPEDTGGTNFPAVACAVFAALLPIIPAWALPSAASDTGPTQRFALFETAPPGFRVLPDNLQISAPTFLNASAVGHAVLRQNGIVFLATHARYDNLRPGQRLFQPGNGLAGPSWQPMAGLDAHAGPVCGQHVREHIFRRGDERLLVWSVHLVNGVSVSSGIEEKLRTAISRLTSKRVAGDIIVLTTPVSEPDVARNRFRNLLENWQGYASLGAQSGVVDEEDNSLCAA